MKFWEIIRKDLDPNSGYGCGETTLKYSANKQKVDEFVKDWEQKWKENYDKKYSEIGHCWMDCCDELIIKEHELEDC